MTERPVDDDSAFGINWAGSALVAVGMLLMNVAVYAFSLIAAHLLIPAEFGAFTALLSILQIGSVASLGLQAAGARRIAVAAADHAATVSTVVRSTAWVSVLVGAAVALSAPLATEILRLDSPWLVPLCGVALVPLTAMGGLSAIAQGSERWGVLTAINIANGAGRLGAGALALWLSPTVFGAMVGLAIGALAPAVVALLALDLPRRAATPTSRRSLLGESLLSTTTLCAFFAFGNIDALVARNQLSEHQSGLYAAGLIISKTALLGPGFVSVVLFPRFARDTTGASRLRGVVIVAAIGAMGVALVAALPRLATEFAGGHQYAGISDRLWLFALAGSLLGVAQLLVFDALARHTHWIAWLLASAAVAVPVIAVVADVGVTGLVATVAGVTAVLTVALLPQGSRRR
ncbi:MAG TPA: oligosaccharide flippase family protein [Aeromicrobium sp.]|nr:oligosaccharide flippase family protein [Aeromicrobium sp.]